MNPIIVIIKSLLWWLNQPFMPLFFWGGGQIHIQTFQPTRDSNMKKKKWLKTSRFPEGHCRCEIKHNRDLKIQ